MINESMFQKQLTAGVVKENSVSNEDLVAQIAMLKKELEAMKQQGVVKTTVKKNQKVGVASPTRKYVLLSKALNAWGSVPQQQADIAKLLLTHLTVGTAYTEAEVFNTIIDGSGEYKSLYSSKQDPTYLFRYYRGLKNDGKHAGFIAREFIKVID